MRARVRAAGTGTRRFASGPWRALALAAAALVALVALACPAAAQPAPAGDAAGAAAVVDDRGARVRVAAPPARIVTLMPSLTESVCALGACDRIVAVDRFSDHPPSVRSLPRLGGLGDTDVEGVVAARPGLVLVSPSARVAERLESLGLTVAAFDARTVDDVRRVLVEVSRLIGSGDAQRVWRETLAGIDAAARGVPAAARGMRAYVEVDEGYAAGEASYLGQLLARLGLRDVVPEAMGPYPRLNPEFVVRSDPQLILLLRGDASAALSRPGWQGIDAVRAGRVCRFTPAERDVLVRPGPRLAEAARVVARCLDRVATR